ncbi:MAG: helix-turn-helix domain-containing protein [Candidatus Aminicenantaceae bacterium]
MQRFFQSYDWPGNVRELRDVLESAVRKTDKSFVDVPDLPEYFKQWAQEPGGIPYIRREDLSTLDELEEEYIPYLLRVTQNNLSRTAQIMGISRSTLDNKIKKYDIPH